MEEVTLALSASRKEADALREQVNLKQQHRPLSTPPLASSTFGGFDPSPRVTNGAVTTASERQEQIWREVLAQSRRQSSTPKNHSSLVRTVQNNLHYQASSSAANGVASTVSAMDYVVQR